MISEQQLEIYRRMTPGERLELTFEMLDQSFPYLLRGPADVVDRRFELLNKQNDERNRNMLAGLARAQHDSH